MGLFPNAWTVTVREFRLRMDSRIFKVVTLILALIGLGLALLPVGISALGLDEPSSVSVYAAAPDAEDGAAALVASLDAMEQITLDGEARSIDELKADLKLAKESATTGVGTAVLIHGDARCDFQHIAAALTACRAAGIADVGVSVDTDDKPIRR